MEYLIAVVFKSTVRLVINGSDFRANFIVNVVVFDY